MPEIKRGKSEGFYGNREGGSLCRKGDKQTTREIKKKRDKGNVGKRQHGMTQENPSEKSGGASERGPKKR